MQLTQGQIQQIDNYISACGIKYYDVKAEIVDHFASILELRLEENPELDFKETLIEEYKKFGDRKFKKLIYNKTTKTQNKFLKLTLKNLRSFFKLPKLIITIALYVGLYKLMGVFKEKEDFFELLSGIGIFIMFVVIIRFFRDLRVRKQRFLLDTLTNIILQFVNSIFIVFNTTVTFRTDKSFLNVDYNTIHLAFFVVLLLFYWSMEYVYQQNRKTVQQQYPEILV